MLARGMRRFDFALRTDATGTGTGDSGNAKAGDGHSSDAPALCDPTMPFETPVPISELNVAGAYDSTITLTADELTTYWYSDRAGPTGAFDLYTATRPDLGSPFTNITALAAVNSPQVDKEPAISPDGSMLAFISTRTEPNGDLYLSMPVGATPIDITNLSSASSEYHPFFEVDTSDFYFASNRNGNFSIFHSTYLGGGAFANPTQVTSLDDPGYDTDVAVAMVGGLVMYVRSSRPGGPGGEDIWRATRATTSDGWGAPVVETELDSAELDTPSWILARRLPFLHVELAHRHERSLRRDPHAVTIAITTRRRRLHQLTSATTQVVLSPCFTVMTSTRSLIPFGEITTPKTRP